MDDASPTPSGAPHFDAVPTSRRSLSRWGRALSVAGLAALLGAIGFAFWSLGAWPVAGFCCLKAVLLWGAFELNEQSGRSVEAVRLDDRFLRIDRIAPRAAPPSGLSIPARCGSASKEAGATAPGSSSRPTADGSRSAPSSPKTNAAASPKP